MCTCVCMGEKKPLGVVLCGSKSSCVGSLARIKDKLCKLAHRSWLSTPFLSLVKFFVLD